MKSGSLFVESSMSWVYGYKPDRTKPNHFFICLQWKSYESTKHLFNQMLLAINWRYWQAGKTSRMFMKVQGRLTQGREIHKVSPQKSSGIF